jgi:hypothetical protein
MSAPRVFISYAQYSPEHSARVLELAEGLRQHGIDADLDQFHRHELLDWPRWCQEQLQSERSDWVLMVCSKSYRDRIENRVDPHTGKGAFWEGALIDDQLYQAKGNRRFVPVLLDDESGDSIPVMVRGWTWFRVHGMDFADPGFKDLYRLLTRQPAVAMPPLGRRTDLGPDRAVPDGPPPLPRPADAERPRHPPVQSRAVRLLQAFFANDDERTRRTIVNLAFGDCERDPRPVIQYAGAALVFADHLVDTLLTHGCVGRGRHSLSLLIETTASARGRQTDPDYVDLPPLLDDLCALPTRDEEVDYLQRLLGEIEEKARLYAPLRGIADIKPAAQAAALLTPWADDEDIALLMHRPRSQAGAEGAEQREYEDILAAFADVKQAALLGAPGAGKSTTLRRLAADLGRAVLESPQAPLPIFVSLGDWRGDEGLSEFLRAHVPEIGWAAQALSKEARLILLLDGLNEVPTARREAKAAGLLAFKDALAKDTPCIVSCRRDDYVGDLDLGLDTLSLEPLTPQRIRQVLRHWLPDDAQGVEPGSAERLFWQLAGDERLAGVLATWVKAGSSEDAFWSVADPQQDEKAYAKTSVDQDEIWRRNVPNPRSLLRLAANPFMLTMLYQVWAFEGELPRNRGDLFTRFVDRLLSRERLLVRNGDTGVWERTSDGERLLCGLTSLAWIMQGERLDRGETGEGGFGVLTVIARDTALKELDGEALLKKAEDATLLEGNEEIRFRHQLLQEYFTASALRSHIQDRPPLLAAELWPAERWWERSGWEESAVLLAGLYSEDCAPVARWLRDAQPEVAAQCVLESGAEIDDRHALFREGPFSSPW